VDTFLNSILRGLITYQIGIFIILGLGFILYLRQFLKGLSAWRESVFGLERNLAQRHLFSALTGLVLLFLLILGEFLLVVVIKPQMPSTALEETPRINPLASQTPTLSSNEIEETLIPTPTVGQDSLVSDCVEGVLEITYPGEGEAVSGTVEIIGSVNVENFGSYKYEYSSAGAVDWVTIAAGNQLRLDEGLGFWYTSELPPGRYLLQLVPLNNQGEEMTPCIISVEVVSEE
jgi:hypothetical protein